MSDKNTSKFISLILRHKPETIGITLDEHGWANVSELISGVNETHPLDMEILERALHLQRILVYLSLQFRQQQELQLRLLSTTLSLM